ncbi:hypothetical protein IBE03_03365, partial [Francisella tularensis]|nr:hypothetical protein [Francisella tularensis]
LILSSVLLDKWIDNYPERKELGNGYYALLAFIAKFSYAIATLITLPLIDSSYSTDPDNLNMILRIVYCVLPCIMKLSAALIIFIWYKKLANNYNRL